MASLPRGSLTTAERTWSKRARKRSRRSAMGPVPSSGPPATTTRVGSPPVWESMMRILWLIPIQVLILEHLKLLARQFACAALVAGGDGLHQLDVGLGRSAEVDVPVPAQVADEQKRQQRHQGLR